MYICMCAFVCFCVFVCVCVLLVCSPKAVRPNLPDIKRSNNDQIIYIYIYKYTHTYKYIYIYISVGLCVYVYQYGHTTLCDHPLHIRPDERVPACYIGQHRKSSHVRQLQ